jgi:hypothetical protein
MNDPSPHDDVAEPAGRRLRRVVLAPRLHLAFVHAVELEKLLDGVKTCESRLSQRLHPARSVLPGDALLFKAGDVGAAAIVLRVDAYSSASPLDVTELMVRYTRSVDGRVCDLDYWLSKSASRHAVFLHLDTPVPLVIPRTLLPSTRSAWVADFKPPREVRRLLDEALTLAWERE